jgi:hypothetical protein
MAHEMGHNFGLQHDDSKLFFLYFLSIVIAIQYIIFYTTISQLLLYYFISLRLYAMSSIKWVCYELCTKVTCFAIKIFKLAISAADFEGPSLARRYRSTWSQKMPEFPVYFRAEVNHANAKISPIFPLHF